jgi:DNA-binding NtrC family response regulator
MNMSAIVGGSLIAVNCDEDTQKIVLEISRESCIAITFMTFAEFIIAGLPSQEVILVGHSRRANRLIEMIGAIRTAHPEAEIIILSRGADERLWCEALALGACDLLPVPPERSNLLLAVAKARAPKKTLAPSECPAVA